MGSVIGYILDCINREWSDPAGELPYETKEGGYEGEVLYTHELLWELGVNVDNDSIHGD
jgi:hypothetical protein